MGRLQIEPDKKRGRSSFSPRSRHRTATARNGFASAVRAVDVSAGTKRTGERLDRPLGQLREKASQLAKGLANWLKLFKATEIQCLGAFQFHHLASFGRGSCDLPCR
jgi:hypothetical protein